MRHSPKHFDEIASLFSASCPSANCPFGKMTVRQNVCSAKRPSAKCPFGKMSFGKVSFGKMSGYRGKRLTSSNFGPIVNRRRQRYPETLMSNIKSSRSKCPKPCQWGKDKECEAIMEYARATTNKGTLMCAHIAVLL